MNVDTFPPQSTVTSKPLIHPPAQYLPRFDVFGGGKLPPKYQSRYQPEAHFPPEPPVGSSNGQSSGQNMNETQSVSQDWDTPKVTQISEPSSAAMSSNPYTKPFFFQPPSNSRPTPPTIYGRMASPANRQRTTKACNNCRDRKTKVRELSVQICVRMAHCDLCSVLASTQCVSAALLVASSAVIQMLRVETQGSETPPEFVNINPCQSHILRRWRTVSLPCKLLPLSLLRSLSAHRTPFLGLISFLGQQFLTDGFRRRNQ